jgi:hypothetical protein
VQGVPRVSFVAFRVVPGAVEVAAGADTDDVQGEACAAIVAVGELAGH